MTNRSARHLLSLPIRLCLAGFLGLALAGLSACSDSKSGDPDGDLEADLERSDLEGEGNCESGQTGCFVNMALACIGGVWYDREDCALSGKVCDQGVCVRGVPDGDSGGEAEEEAEADGEEGEQIDTRPPEVTATLPADGATEVSPALTEVVVTFSESLDVDGFVFQRDVSFTGGGRSILFSGSFSSRNQTLRLSLIDRLDEGTAYTVTLAGDVLHDKAGLSLASFAFGFATSGTPPIDGDAEDDSPRVTRTTPANGATGVSPDLTAIQIHFSEPLETDGYDLSASLTLSPLTPFTPTWEMENALLNLQLGDALPVDTLMTVTLAAGLTDRTGHALGAVQFSFRTAAPADGDLDALEPETEEEAEAIIPNTGVIDDSTLSVCQADPVPPEEFDPESVTPSAAAHWQSGDLLVVHSDVVSDSCYTRFSVRLDQAGTQLELFEEPPPQTTPCGPICPYTFTVRITGLVPASYRISVWPYLAETPLQTTAGAP